MSLNKETKPNQTYLPENIDLWNLHNRNIFVSFYI